jgi:hypothetical protein
MLFLRQGSIEAGQTLDEGERPIFCYCSKRQKWLMWSMLGIFWGENGAKPNLQVTVPQKYVHFIIYCLKVHVPKS